MRTERERERETERKGGRVREKTAWDGTGKGIAEIHTEEKRERMIVREIIRVISYQG